MQETQRLRISVRAGNCYPYFLVAQAMLTEVPIRTTFSAPKQALWSSEVKEQQLPSLEEASVTMQDASHRDPLHLPPMTNWALLMPDIEGSGLGLIRW